MTASAFRRLLASKPALPDEAAKPTWRSRREINAFIEDQKDNFGGVVDMYSSVANFLVDQGIGEATDVLLIDEKLCIGCDNCEKACADSHDGLSRLEPRGRAHLRPSPRADLLPALRASLLHDRLPAQRDPARRRTARCSSTTPASAAATASATAPMA